MAIRARFGRYINSVLEALRDLGGSARPREVYDWVAEHLSIPDEARAVQNKSGVSRFENDVAWARHYLVKAGLVDSSRWGVWSLTETGRTAGTFADEQVNQLMRRVQAQTARAKDMSATPTVVEIESEDIESEDEEDVAPDESAGATPEFRDHREHVLAIMRQLPPAGFERLCQRILREAGFQHVRVTGRSGDGGIDGVGVLQVNPLLTFKVLFQAKRYQGAVTPAQVRDFRGAMQGRADKGLIVTTGTFTTDAQGEAVRDGVPPIELVDGSGLVALLEQLELGLLPRRAFSVDARFFDEFREP